VGLCLLAGQASVRRRRPCAVGAVVLDGERSGAVEREALRRANVGDFAIAAQERAVDKRCAHGGAERELGERRPTALRVNGCIRNDRLTFRIDEHEVGPIAFADVAAFGDVETFGWRMSGLLDHRLDREDAALHEVDQRRQGVLNER
jgi:hypothetical protein